MKAFKLMPLLAAIILMASSCEDKIVPDYPKPDIPVQPEEPDAVWISDCPGGFALNTETHIYAQTNKNVPSGYRASLVSSDERVIRVTPGSTGWDFYITAAILGEATLTLEYNGTRQVYSVSSFQKVIPTLYVDKDYQLRFRLVPSDSEKAVEVKGKLSLQMQGSMIVKAQYMNDQVYGNGHGYETDRVFGRISCSMNEVPTKEPFIVSDLSCVKDALEDGIQSNAWEEDLMYGAGGFYYFWMEDYYPEEFDIRYNMYDEQHNKVELTVDCSAIASDGWKDSILRVDFD